MLLVQLEINSARNVWKYCQAELAPAARLILAKFPTLLVLVLLIPNCTHYRMITYTKHSTREHITQNKIHGWLMS